MGLITDLQAHNMRGCFLEISQNMHGFTCWWKVKNSCRTSSAIWDAKSWNAWSFIFEFKILFHEFSSTSVRYQIPLFCLNCQPVLDRQHKCIPARFSFLFFFFQLLTCYHDSVHCSSYLQVHVQSYILWSLSGRPVNNSVLLQSRQNIAKRKKTALTFQATT